MRTNKNTAPLFLENNAFKKALSRNMTGAGGLLLMAAAFLCFIAIASWSVDDPSFSTATAKQPENILGYAGAIIADLAMQIFGFASLVLLLPTIIWGFYITIKGTIDNEKQRILYWIGAIIISSLGLAFIPIPTTWPLPIGLGGIIGDLISKLPLSIASNNFILSTIIILVTLLGTLFCLKKSCQKVVIQNEKHKREIVSNPNQYQDNIALEYENTEKSQEKWTSSIAPIIGAGIHYTTFLSQSLKIKAARLTQHLLSKSKTYHAMHHNIPDPFERHEPTLSEPQNDNFINNSLETHLILEKNEPSTQQRITQPPNYDDHIAHINEEENFSVSRETFPQRSFKVEEFQFPDVNILTSPPSNAENLLPDTVLENNARLLEGVLEDFGVKGDIINVRPGPVVTLYELEPAPGIKSSRVIGLADDIARSMSAISARVAVIPGRNAIGIELPNTKRETVYLKEMIDGQEFQSSKTKLALALGKTIGGEPVIADLARMPHLLVAGTTGSGKSVSINTMILSLLYRLSPEQCKVIMIDPKMLELSIYDGIPHLLTPVVTDPKKAVVALKWAVREMEDRYRNMSKLGVRNLEGFNARVKQAQKRGETLMRTVQTGFNKETGEPIYEQEELNLEPMPFIVIIVDEMADLMMVAGKEIEGTIQRLAQMARAAGIHLIMATQRPSVDVITGTIKANFPTRISFQVTSKIDSRTILGEMGAEQLLGQGDMLFMAGGGRIQRVHGPFVSDQEVEHIVNHLKSQGAPEYLEDITDEEASSNEPSLYETASNGGDEATELYDKAVAIVLRDKKASTSYVQRRLSIGYNRAATIIERMEDEGIISAANHAGKREILVGDEN